MKITIDNYSELKEYIDQFLIGVFEILIVEGKQGIGKSTVIKKAFEHLDPTIDYLWLEGRTSAAAFYKALYDFVDMPVILDDTDEFLSDRQCVNLLKTLCQTESIKRVQWLTMRLPHDLPSSFFTSSRVIILTNETRKGNPHMKAIQDRGLHIIFKPKKEEIHKKGKILCNQEVYSFIERFLPSIEDLTLRLYAVAQKAYDKKQEWKKTLILAWDLDPLLKVFLEIELNHPDKTREEKMELFTKITNKPERTYERIQGQLKYQNIKPLSSSHSQVEPSLSKPTTKQPKK